MNKLVIISASGLGRETLWVVRECNKAEEQWDILGFVDDNEALRGKIICDVPVLGTFSWLENHLDENIYVICGIGNTKIRRKIAEKGKECGLKFATLIHPSVTMSKYVDIGEGVVITAQNIITTQVKIGNHVFLNLNCTVGHDTILEDFVNCAPSVSVSGNGILKRGCHLYAGVKVGPGVTIGEWTRIGAGISVIKNVPDEVTLIPPKEARSIIKEDGGEKL